MLLAGGPEQAREYYEASLAALRAQRQSGASAKDGGVSYVRRGDEELVCMFMIATAVVPPLYESTEHIAQVRERLKGRERGRLLFCLSSSGFDLVGAEGKVHGRTKANVVCALAMWGLASSRSLQTTVKVQISAPVFGPFCFAYSMTPRVYLPFCLIPVARCVLHNPGQVRRDFERGLDELLAEPLSVSPTGLTSPSISVGSGALGYYIIYQV